MSGHDKRPALGQSVRGQSVSKTLSPIYCSNFGKPTITSNSPYRNIILKEVLYLSIIIIFGRIRHNHITVIISFQLNLFIVFFSRRCCFRRCGSSRLFDRHIIQIDHFVQIIDHSAWYGRRWSATDHDQTQKWNGQYRWGQKMRHFNKHKVGLE